MDLRVIAVRRFRFLPPRLFAMLVRAVFTHEFTTFRNPKTFTEMLVAKNLTDRNPLIPLTADKFAVRAYVSEKVGEQYLIPLVQCVDNANDIDFDSLPSRCVIKGAHGCDMTILVHDAKDVDRDEIRLTVSQWLATDFSKAWKEWIYSQIPPRVVIEEFIGSGEPPADYKFYVFGGKIACVQIHQNRFTNHTTDMFDPSWNRIRTYGVYKQSASNPPKPENYEEMCEVASKLGADFDYARVDLYNVDGKIYFGEITHFPAGGRMSFKPREFDLALGEFWRHGTPLPASLIESAAS